MGMKMTVARLKIGMTPRIHKGCGAPQRFDKGDRITVTDHHTALGTPIGRDYYVTGIDGHYYLLIPSWTSDSFHNKRLPFSYPHVKKA